jgi:RimJ/RimL family protein N-acetyltransferase
VVTLSRELSDGTLTIRAYEPGIEAELFAAARESVREIRPSMGTWQFGATYELAARHVAESINAWQTGAWYDFTISPPHSKIVLGRVGLDDIRNAETANVGYWVRTSQTGQGIATAAVRLVAQFGFENLGLRRLELLIAVDNHASRRVAEKAGARYEGIWLAGASERGDLAMDSHCYVLTRGGR